ncbi:MAG: DUF1553 domain-containing protein, partial [Planctomycetales bacterium]|nr:DUF1553 domain-containing protein [Planctomycetales bacterium]
ISLAFADVVNRLLDSPHYGEQWGRHWLDVVRYADSSGFANDFERGPAWRYRDYVVRSLNGDKPYDRFVHEQLAGDELDPTNPEDPEMLLALGFLRMGPWELTGMEVPKIARQRFLDDVTDAVGQVFLGHMLQCARCHDHKFDPVPTRDYYALQAFFATTQFATRDAPFLSEENCDGFDEQQYLYMRQKRHQAELERLDEVPTVEAARQWYRDNGVDATAFEHVVADLQTHARELASTPPAKTPVTGLADVRRELIKRKVASPLIFPNKVGFTPEDFGHERIARKGLQRLQWQFDRYQPLAFSVYSGHTPKHTAVLAPLEMPADPLSGDLEETAVLAGGDPFRPVEVVTPTVLSARALNAMTPADQPATCDGDDNSSASPWPQGVSGRRTALAHWITDKNNPLTARVMVNRIWQWHFGQAIAGTPNNFGSTGKKPTHPQLLDLLAREFMNRGWSIKEMHRQIMATRAYRRSTEHLRPDQLDEGDPTGTSYAVFLPRRLSAEELRDSMLALSGELNRQVGGIPARPEINMEAALQPRMVMGTFAESWQPSAQPAARHRRSIYALKLRGLRDPFLEVFNAPSAGLSCEARESSTVTPQVFAMFNGHITFQRALALARDLTQDTSRPRADVIDELFQRVVCRSPAPAELERCLEHWQDMTERHETLIFTRPDYPTEVVRTAVEENTGVKFSYKEILDEYADFVPDFQSSDASPVLRGLAEVCLMMLNSNEFVYVY